MTPTSSSSDSLPSPHSKASAANPASTGLGTSESSGPPAANPNGGSDGRSWVNPAPSTSGPPPSSSLGASAGGSGHSPNISASDGSSRSRSRSDSSQSASSQSGSSGGSSLGRSDNPGPGVGPPTGGKDIGGSSEIQARQSFLPP